MRYTKIVNKISSIILIIAVACSSIACETENDTPDSSGLVLQEAIGGWWVIALEPDGATPAYGGDYVKFNTYNSSANDNTLWLDDNGEWMEIKAKATMNISNLIFSSDPEVEELYSGGTVTITNGQITKNSFTTASNTLVDEIYFEAEFDWDPGTAYIFKGHKNTGKVEDLNPHF